MKLRFFDFEVLPNYWLCVFGDLPEDWRQNKPLESIKENFIYVDSDMPDCRDRLLQLMKEPDIVNVGYNIKGYDLIIANGIYQGLAPSEIRLLNNLVINPALRYTTKEYMRLASLSKRRLSGITYLDLMDSVKGSLKDKESTLGLSVLESCVPFDKEHLNDIDKSDLLFYCKHDVYSAMIWFIEIVASFIDAKLALANAFNLDIKDAYCLTNAQLVAKALSADFTVFPDAEKQEILLPTTIAGYINKCLPAEIVNYVCNNTKSKSFNLFNNIVVYADGGIHSTYDTQQAKGERDILFVESDSEYAITLLDVSSFYPAIMIMFDTLSRSIKNPERFKFVYEDRIRIKHKPNKTEHDDQLQKAYKLILNTTYGASGCEFLALSDPYQRTRTCRFGQLLLTALANDIVKQVPSTSVLQTNTDGLFLFVKRTELSKVLSIKDAWCNLTKLGMDVEYAAKLWQRDVNNYLLVKDNGKIKRRGQWLVNNRDKAGIAIAPLDCWGVSKAAIEFLVYDKNPLKVLLNNTNLEDFCIYCMKGPTFKGVVQKFADGTEKELFKGNRVIATKNKNNGSLYKYKETPNGRSYNLMPNAPENCLLVNNDLSTYDFAILRKELDYSYYVKRLYEKLVCTKDNKDLIYKQLIGTDLVHTSRFNLDF